MAKRGSKFWYLLSSSNINTTKTLNSAVSPVSPVEQCWPWMLSRQGHCMTAHCSIIYCSYLCITMNAKEKHCHFTKEEKFWANHIHISSLKLISNPPSWLSYGYVELLPVITIVPSQLSEAELVHCTKRMDQRPAKASVTSDRSTTTDTDTASWWHWSWHDNI